MMNQVHIGVIAPVMEDGKIQPFQAQRMTTQGGTTHVSVMEA